MQAVTIRFHCYAKLKLTDCCKIMRMTALNKKQYTLSMFYLVNLSIEKNISPSTLIQVYRQITNKYNSLY